jgi:hypothetical protein
MQYRMAPQIREIVSGLTYSKTPLVDAESISERVDDLPGSLLTFLPEAKRSRVLFFDVHSTETEAK